MITIFCGDDTVRSREAYAQHIQEYVKRGYSTVSREPGDIAVLVEGSGSDSHDELFVTQRVFTTQDLIPVFKRKFPRKSKPAIEKLANDKTIEIVTWEDASTYDLGIDKEKWSFVNEYKAKESTFTLLPLLRPGSAAVFVTTLQRLTDHQPIEVTMSMILRHVRLMILTSSGTRVIDSPYLTRLATSGAHLWQFASLISLYQNLYKIEINTKTSQSPLSLQAQLEILASIALA